MIEMRPKISGFYKGLVYCRGKEQAQKVKEMLDVNLQYVFGTGVISMVKRGCSEYSLRFPEYGRIKSDTHSNMEHPIHWKTIEDHLENQYQLKLKTYKPPSISDFCLSDFHIIQKWIDYAKGLADPTSKHFEDRPILFDEVYKIAKARRLEFHKDPVN